MGAISSSVAAAAAAKAGLCAGQTAATVGHSGNDIRVSEPGACQRKTQLYGARGVGYRRAAGAMYGRHSRVTNELCNVVRVEAGTSHYLDSITRLLDELTYPPASRGCAGCASGSQHAFEAETDGCLQRRSKIRNHVKRAVEHR